MYPLRQRGVWHLRDGFWDLLLALPLFLVYFTSLQQGVGWWDSGELIAAIKELTIAHRPGFPLYVLVGHVLAGWPTDPRFWANLLSAVSAALALLFVWKSFRLMNGGGGLSALWTLAGGWLVGLSPLFWRQAVRAEVYAPAFLVLSVALLLTAGAQRAPDPRYAQRRFLGAAYFAGLAFCMHTALAAAVWPALIYMFLRGDFRPSLRQWLKAAMACAAGLSVYLYVPLRAAHAPYVWGDPTTIAGLWQYLTASDSYSVIATEASGTLSRVAALFEVVRANAPGLLTLVGTLGLVIGAFRKRACDRAPLVLLAAGGLVAATVVSTVIEDNLDLQAYLFPILLATWWGWNQADPARWASRLELSPFAWRLSAVATSLLLVLVALLSFRDGRTETAMFEVGTADKWGTALLGGARDGELVILQDANTDFLLRGLMSADTGLARVVILNTALSPAAWYRRWWAGRYLDSGAPEFKDDETWARSVASWWREERAGVRVDYGCAGWTADDLVADGWLARWDGTAPEFTAIPQFALAGADSDPDWVRTAVWYYYRLGDYYLKRGMIRPAAMCWDEGLRWAPGETTLQGLRADLAASRHAELGMPEEGLSESP